MISYSRVIPILFDFAKKHTRLCLTIDLVIVQAILPAQQLHTPNGQLIGVVYSGLCPRHAQC